MTARQSIAVVTRPAPDHAGLLHALERRGFTVVHSPAVERIADSADLRRDRIHALRNADVLIVISPYAARLLLETAGHEPLRGARVVTPGAGTGRPLADAGFRVEWPESGGTSEDLLAGPLLDLPSGTRVGIVGAPGGRRLLDRELALRGATVGRIDLYRRRPCKPSEALFRALDSPRPLVVTISSTGAFETLDAGIDSARAPRWRDAHFVVSSDRVAEACRSAGMRRIVTAGGASDRSMLAAVEALDAA